MSEGRRAAWTLGDQLLSSSTNALLPLLVARSVSAWEFGSFAVAFLLYSLAVGLIRAVVTDPLLIQHSNDPPDRLRVASAQAAGAALVLGLAGSVACAAAAVPLSGTTAEVLLALAVLLPGLLVQDTWRRSFFAANRPAAACANDVVWSSLQLCGVVVLTRAGTPGGVDSLLMVWGLAGLVAAAVGCWQVGALPMPIRGSRWCWERRRLGGRLGLDFAVSQGSFSVSLVVASLIAGVAAVGGVRGAQVLLAPVQVLLLATASFALPMLARATDDGGRLRRLERWLTRGAVGLAALYVVPLVLLPDSWGSRLLGASWPGTAQVLPLLAVQTMLLATATAPALVLKSLSRAGTLVSISLIQSTLMLTTVLAGAAVWGGRGIAAGLVVSHLVGTVLMRRSAAAALLSDPRDGGTPGQPSDSGSPGPTPGTARARRSSSRTPASRDTSRRAGASP